MSRPIRYSCGNNTFDNLPVQCEARDFDVFASEFLSRRGTAKGQFYVCGPFHDGAHSNPDAHPEIAPWRSKALADARDFLPFDVDGFAAPADAEAFLVWLNRAKGFAYHTASHSDSEPRLRVVLAQSRATTREEGIALGAYIQREIERELGAGRIKFDRSVYKAEQPIYTPLVGAEVFHFAGTPVNVDKALTAAPSPVPASGTAKKSISDIQRQKLEAADPIWQSLDIFGNIKQHLGSGKYAIVCPFEHEHTGKTSDSSTVYFLAGLSQYPFGAFHCLHAHCENRSQDEFIAAAGLDPCELRHQLALSGIESSGNTDKEKVSRLAALPSIEYDRLRLEAAKSLGIRVDTLDSQVKAARTQKVDAEQSMFPLVEVWPREIDPIALLTEVEATILKYVACDRETALATTLWIAMTWFIDVIEIAPLALITAPEKRCGKTTLLSVMGRMVRDPLPSGNISPAALFRSVDKFHPTMLIDEVDTFFRNNDEMRGIINCGHTRDTAFVIRTVGDDHVPTKFNVWGAKALAGIGDLPDTVMDRSIVLPLRRRFKDEYVEPLRRADRQVFKEISSRLLRFANDYCEVVGNARLILPEVLNDRAQDNWEPLLGIADAVGGDFPGRARGAAEKISGDAAPAVSVNIQLLMDVQAILKNWPSDRISTVELTAALCNDDESQWAQFNRGQAIQPGAVSRRLKSFGVGSQTIRDGINTFKGFYPSHFDDVFKRYLS